MFKIYFEVYIAFLGDYEFVRGGAVNLICDPSEMYISGNKLMKAWGILIFLVGDTDKYPNKTRVLLCKRLSGQCRDVYMVVYFHLQQNGKKNK